MRLSHPGRHPQSHAHLEPLQRLAVIPLVSAILGLAYSLAQSTLHESRSQVVGSLRDAGVRARTADWLSRESRRRSA